MSSFKAVYISAGNDYYAALERVAGDDELLNDLMLMFLADDNWNTIKTAAAEGECEKAFRAAHSLKGSSGMLGMTAFYKIMIALTDEFRNGNLAGGIRMLPEAEREYNAVVELIKENI